MRFLLMMIPAISMLLIIINNGVNVPYYDEFSNPFRVLALDYTHQLTSAELIRQFNDSRKLISNAIFIFFLRIFGYWNIKFQLYFTWSLGVVTILLLSILSTRTARKDHPSYRWLSPLVWVSMSALVFSFTAYYRWLWGITLHRIIPDFCMVLSAVIMTLNYRAITKSLALAACATIALFSFSGGIIISFVNLGLLFSIRQIKKNHIFTYLIIVAISIFNFLNGYEIRDNSANAFYFYSWSQLLENFRFVMSFLGNPFSKQSDQAFAIGLLIFAVFNIFSVIGLVCPHIAAPTAGETLRRNLFPWIAIGSYAILCGVLTAYFRAGANLVSPLDIRYILHANYLTIALLGGMLVWITHHDEKTISLFNFSNDKLLIKGNSGIQFIVLCIFILIYLLLSFNFIKYNWETYPIIHQHKYRLLYGKSCLQLNSYLEDKSCLDSIFPNPNTPQFLEKLNRIHDLKILQPGIFNINSYHHFQLKTADVPMALGQFEQIQSLGHDQWRITGFALLPSLRPADAIVVVDPERSRIMDKLIIVTLGKSGLRRSDLRQHLGSDYRYAGWSVEVTVNSRSLSQLEFFAFDAETNRFFRILDTLSH